MPLYLPQFNLQHYNSLASPVAALFFVSVNTEAELLAVIKFSRERNLPLLVLGGGSNVILRDDFPGVVVHIHLQGKEVVAEDDHFIYVKAAAGENWHNFVEYCLDNHCWGLENLSLIPGSVGAAPIQNIGAYGVELKDVFSELTALDVKSGLSVTFTKDSCQFNYRDSVFKGALKDKYIITSVTFKLYKQQYLILDYPVLRDAVKECVNQEINPVLISKLVCNIRQSKLPEPKQIPNVGSFFKNPIISQPAFELIRKNYPTVIYYPAGNGEIKLAAGWLIDRAGWKGFSDQHVAVHSQQALVLTNPHRLKGEYVLALAQKIQASIVDLFGIQLEIEPRIYPALGSSN